MSNAFSVNCILTAILSFGFGLIIASRRSRAPSASTVDLWAAVCVAVACWSFGLGMMTASSTQQIADRWIRRDPFQIHLGRRRSGWRHRLALAERPQLLRRARQRQRKQRLALLHHTGYPHHHQVRRCAGAAQRVAHFARGNFRQKNPRAAQRQALHRSRGRTHQGRRRSRSLDQG